MLEGEIQPTQLDEKEAVAFAQAISEIGEYVIFTGTSPEDAKRYLIKHLQMIQDSAEQGLSHIEVTGDAAASTFLGKDSNGNIRRESTTKRKHKTAHIPEDWQPITTASKEMVGDYYVLKVLILTIYDGAPPYSDSIRKTNEIGRAHTYISPKYKEWLIEQGILRPIALAAPDLTGREDWQSASMLYKSRKYIGSNAPINNQFIAYQEDLIACLQAAGMTQDHAKQWVEENAIGTYREKNGPATLFAAPWVIEWMKKENVLRLQENAAPSAPPHFQSVPKIRSKVKGRHRAVEKKFWGEDAHAPPEENSVVAHLVLDIAQTLQISSEEALLLAEHNLAGIRKPPSGPEARMFGLDVIRNALQKGILQRRDGKKDIPNEEIQALLDARNQARKESKSKE